MRKIIVIFMAVFFSAILFVGSVSEQIRADDFTITEPDRYPSPNSGKVKALIVRVGYEDYPVDDSNKYYTSINDDMLHLMFEGQEGGIGLPFNGLSDYLYKSSYGAMSMEIGEIIDIQMDGTAESYYSNDSNVSYGNSGWVLIHRYPTDMLNSDEFAAKLREKVDLGKYDIDDLNGVDALYIFDVAGDVWWSNVALVCAMETFDNVQQKVAYFRPKETILLDNIDYQLKTIVH